MNKKIKDSLIVAERVIATTANLVVIILGSLATYSLYKETFKETQK
jgi:hypothetical protein